MGKTGKKPERKSRNKSDQNTKNQKTKIWDERNINVSELQCNDKKKRVVNFDTRVWNKRLNYVLNLNKFTTLFLKYK